MKHRSREAIVLFAIVLVAAVLRLWGLGSQSLWIDEVLSVRQAQAILRENAAAGLFNDHGPLFFYVLAAVMPASGGEFALRLPAAVFGIAFVIVAFFLGRDLLGGRRGGIAAAATAALSPFAVWYSQEVRYVGLFILLAGLSLLYTHRFARGASRLDWLAYCLSTLLMMFTFVVGAFLILGQNLWFAIARPPRAAVFRWILAQIVVGTLFLAWLVPAYRIDLNPFDEPESSSFSLRDAEVGFGRDLHPVQIGYALYTFGVGYSLGPSVRELHRDLSLTPVRRQAAVVLAAAVLFGALGIAGVTALVQRSAGTAVLLGFALCVPLLLPYLIATVSGVVYNVRYAAAAFPAFVLILAAGASRAARSRTGIAAAAATAALLCLSLRNYYDVPEYARDDNRGAARILAAQRATSQPLLVGAEPRALRFYYAAPFDSWSKVTLLEASTQEGAAPHLPVDRVWVAATRTWESPGFEKFLKSMDACYPAAQRFHLPGFDIVAYEIGAGAAGGCRLYANR